MPKIKQITDMQVVVEVDYGYSHRRLFPCRSDTREYKEALGEAEAVVAQIRRHVDNISQHGASIRFTTEDICSHCGCAWEVCEDDDDPDCPRGMPLCCGAARAEWENDRAAKSAGAVGQVAT